MVLESSEEGTDADRAYLVDTPVREFSASVGVLTSGRTSGVSPVRGGVNPSSGPRVASSITALFIFIFILMILTYPTQNLVKNRHWGTYIVLIISNYIYISTPDVVPRRGMAATRNASACLDPKPRVLWNLGAKVQKNIDIDLLYNGRNI